MGRADGVALWPAAGKAESAQPRFVGSGSPTLKWTGAVSGSAKLASEAQVFRPQAAKLSPGAIEEPFSPASAKLSPRLARPALARFHGTAYVPRPLATLAPSTKPFPTLASLALSEAQSTSHTGTGPRVLRPNAPRTAARRCIGGPKVACRS